MTMADGEGRPLDEIEAGDDDPQGWYFDLPGGAWERQEEKNRTLRQRVLGNLTEEEAARKREPFATRPPEPEPEKKGGLFGFGRKKKDAEKPRESAGGTWVLNRGADDAASDDDEPDSWSTEPPLNLPPPQSEPILLRRRPQEDRDADAWGPSDGGFDLGGGRDDEEAETDDGLAGMRAWAHGARDDAQDRDMAPADDEFEPAVAEETESAAAFIEEPVFDDEPEFAGDEPVEPVAPVYAEVMEDDGQGDEATGDFLAGVRAWAESTDDSQPALAEVFEETEDAEPEPDPGVLRLRPRSHDDDGKRLDWSFGPGGWDEPKPAEEPAAEAPDDSLSAMRAWAERNREADHPHFTVEHKDDAEEPEAELPAPLPLRPLHRDEPEVRRPLNLNPNPAPPVDGPRDLPLIRRSRTENDQPERDPAAGPTKWDEFFNLKPDAETEGDEDSATSGSLSEGLSAMRDWAKTRPEPSAPQEIPEEFLKPFDWETEEDGSDPTNEIPDELLKPFDWELEEDAEPESVDSDAVFEAPPEAPVFELPGDELPAREMAPLAQPEALVEADDDDLDIFARPEPALPAPKAEKKPGLVGRLFGRKKKQEAEPLIADTDSDAGDWILPTDDASEDVRVAEPGANDADEEEDGHGQWSAASSTVFASDPRARTGTAGWGGSRSAGWTDEDQDAINSFTDELTVPTGDTVADEDDFPASDGDEPETTFEWTAEDDDLDSEPDAAVDGPVESAVAWAADESDEDVAFLEDDDEELTSPVLEPVAFATDEPDEPPAFASTVEPLFESASEDEDTWSPEPIPAATFIVPPVEDEPIEAVAEQPAEPVAEVTEPVAETPWWERSAVEDEPTEAVAEQPMEAVAEVIEPAAETPWWDRSAVEDEPAAEQPIEVVAEVTEPVAETPWWERSAVEDEPAAEQPIEVVAEVTEPVSETPWWERSAVEDESVEAVAEQPVEAVAEVIEPVAETPWWERSAVEDEPVEAVAQQPVEAVAEVTEPAAETPWWERTAVEDEPTEAVAEQPVEAVAEVIEPVAETPWWERSAVEDEPVEAVAEQPVEVVAEVTEPVAETPWWERSALEDEPLEAVAEQPAEAVADVTEPVAETPWWERSAVEDEPVETVAEQPVEVVAEASEPVAETPWWERSAAEDEPVEAVAEQPLEAVAEASEPVAETPWWERSAAEDEPTEAVAEQPVEAVAEVTEPAAETPWWERSAVEDEPIEAVAEQPADVVAEVTQPVAETPWWERSAVEDEAVEAVAEQPAEAVAEVTEPVAETPWWERTAVEDEPVETVAEQPLEAVAEVTEPVAETPWWQKPVADLGDAEMPTGADAEPVAPIAEKKWWEEAAIEDEPGDVADIATQSAAFVPPVEDDSPWAVADETAAATVQDDDDDPWAEFVTPGSATSEPEEPVRLTPVSWSVPTPAPQPEAPAEDMWGDIAARAEEVMKSPVEDDRLDLAASLESQMAEEPAAPGPWDAPAREWSSEATDFTPAEDEDDVILRAFEAHAATPDKPEEPDPELVRETEKALAELFGSEAEDIVAESSDEGNEKSFIRMSAWAPQRSIPMDGGWAAEEEVEAQLSGASYASIAGGDAGFAPPPWAVDEFGGGSPAAARHHSKTKTWIRELVETGLLALLVFLSVRASFQNFKVDGNSMYPTLEDGQFLIVNKLVYSEVDMEKLGEFVPFIDAGDDPKQHVFHGPERGDIIVLRDPRNPETDLIKRVIGLPGETIEIIDGKVYINDFLLDEPYITAPWSDNKAKILIPDNEYFVMGDNRDNSLDSRSSQVGLVQEDLIIGKAMLSYWPRAKFGLAPNDGGELTDQKPVLTTQRLED